MIVEEICQRILGMSRDEKFRAGITYAIIARRMALKGGIAAAIARMSAEELDAVEAASDEHNERTMPAYLRGRVFDNRDGAQATCDAANERAEQAGMN